MINFLRFCFPLFLLTAGLFHPKKAVANSAAAGELMYQWVSGSTYDLYVKLYRDCAGGPEPTTITVCYISTCNGYQDTVLLNKIAGNLPAAACGSGLNGGNASTLSAGCPNILTTCQDPNATMPGYQEFWYSARVMLPTPCNYWRFSTSIPYRNPAITNIANPSATALYLEATLYSAAGTGENPGNSNPCFSVPPIYYTRNAIQNNFNIGTIDLDGDSLTYQLIMPRDQGSGCNGVNTAFSASNFNLLNNPLSTGGTFLLNSITGQITFTSMGSQVANIAILIKEYQNGVLRGSTVREIQFAPLLGFNSNTLPQPILPTIITGGQLLNGRYEGCVSQPLQFCFPVVGADSNARLVATDNHNNPPPGTQVVAPGASLTYSGIYQDSMNVCFSWTPTSQNIGLHTIVIDIQDTICRPPGYPNITTINLPIYISAAAPVAGPVNVSGASPTYTFSTISSSQASSYYWDFGDGTTSTVRTPTHTFTIPGRYTVTFYTANGCGFDSSDTTVGIIASDVTGVTTSENAIGLFPNPAKSQVTLQNNSIQSMKTIQILDIIGSLVSEVKGTGNKTQNLDVSILPTGTYMVRIEIEGGTIVVRRLQITR